MATNFLLEHHLNPYLVMTKTKSSSTMERVYAFKDVLKANQLPNMNDRILQLNLTSDKFLENVPELDRFLKKLSKETTPAGIFGINDNVAYMIIRAAQRLQIKVPEQISVIGFDGSSFSEISAPKITTIVQDTDKIAVEACRVLVQQMNNQVDQELPRVINIPVKLVVKESTI